MGFFVQLLIQGLCIGFLYAIAALGFVMIFKSSSVLNFAHGQLLAIGAFLFLVFSSWARLPIPIAFLITLLGSFVLGFIIERLFLRPLIGEALVEVIMMTIGLSFMFMGLLPTSFRSTSPSSGEASACRPCTSPPSSSASSSLYSSGSFSSIPRTGFT